MTITVSAAFDSGAIRVLGIEEDVIRLAIPADNQSDLYQWFHFRVAGARGRTLTFRLENCAGASYPDGWPGYRARVSTDRHDWVAASDTTYIDGVLSWTHRFDTELAWFAYFQPYTLERHDAMIAAAALRPGATYRELGRSVDGRSIDCLVIGDGPKQVWLFGRQHPGEPMAEWWMEGAMEMLTDVDNATSRLLREKSTIHLVPNMNPDGSFRGHLRGNAVGVNLNREWQAPSIKRSPEVLCVRNAMDETGVHFAIDVHGDEGIPANFFDGFEGISSWDGEAGRKYHAFAHRLEARTPDFQTAVGYEEDNSGQPVPGMATHQIASRFDAVAITLEMPFKDHDANPDALHGWSGERSKALAVSCLETLAEMIDEI